MPRFEERATEGWTGNSYDWTAVAHVLVVAQMPDLESNLKFGPEAGTFSRQGSRIDLEKPGKAVSEVFHNDATFRDLLSHAELDWYIWRTVRQQ